MREQLATEDEAAGYFRERARRRNPVVTASASGWDLVEYDGDRDELNAKHEIPHLPATLGWQSRRGPHMVFTAPAGELPVKIQIDESGVLVSSDGYLVAAPAWRKKHGVVYALSGTLKPVKLPDEVRELLIERGSQTRCETKRRFAQGEEIPKGHRDVGIFWFAVDLLRSGIEPSEALKRVLTAAHEQCRPPLDPKLAGKQFKGAVRFVAAHPTETEKARAEARRILGERRDRWAGRARTGRTIGADWEEPVPLAAAAAAPSFPLDVLPPWLRSWALETAREKGASVDLTGTLALGAIAGAVARHVQVSPRPGWFEPLNLYLVVALEPGQRKSPIFKAAFRPVRTLERRRIREWEERTELVNLSGAIRDKRRKQLIDEVAGDEQLDPEWLRERLDEKLGDLRDAERVPRPRLLTEDVTPEGLAQLLAEHGRIIAASDEGAAIFENFSGRYTHGSTSWDVYNKAHSGVDLVVDRKGSGPVIVWDPALTLVIATQPGMLRDLWSKPGAAVRGVLARPLYALPGPAYAIGRTLPVEAAVLEEFESRMRSLYEDVPLLALDEEERPLPLTMRLGPMAEASFEQYELELARKRRRLGTSEDAEDEAAYLGWLSKLAGQTARLAGCLHAAAFWTSGSTGSTTIESDSVGAAVELTRYFHAHAMVVFGVMGERPEQRRAATILGWLSARSRQELEGLTVRDVHRSRGKGTSAVHVRAALALLEQHGFVRLEKRSAPKQGGRPSERVHVNPVLTGSSVRPDETDRAPRSGGVLSVQSGQSEHSSSQPPHRDQTCLHPRRWLAHDRAWRCLDCEPPFPGEVVASADEPYPNDMNFREPPT